MIRNYLENLFGFYELEISKEGEKIISCDWNLCAPLLGDIDPIERC